MRDVRVYAKDGRGFPLQHSDIAAYAGDRLVGKALDSNGQAQISASGPDVPIRIVVEYDHDGRVLKQERLLAIDQSTVTIPFPEVILEASTMDLVKQNIPAVIGLFLLLVALALGFAYPDPTEFQIFLIRAVFSLGAGGVASVIPGFFQFNAGLGAKFGISAGGALAVLALMYIVNPPRAGDSGGSIPINALSTMPAGNAVNSAESNVQ